MKSRLTLALPLLAMLAMGQAHGLEPETGIYAGSHPPDPYDLTLRRVLLDADSYRLCQLLAAPSFETESAVYMVAPKDPKADYVVVSRRMKEHLWPAMMRFLEKRSKDGSFSINAQAQSEAMASLRPAADTWSAPIAPEVGKRLDRACTAVLKSTRYPDTPGKGLDGTTYHAGHWISGQFFAGSTWSPDPGTPDAIFVDMELALQRYARSPKGSRNAALVAMTKALARVERQFSLPSQTSTNIGAGKSHE